VSLSEGVVEAVALQLLALLQAAAAAALMVVRSTERLEALEVVEPIMVREVLVRLDKVL
tara:strand:+ start:930 stop:1106 length:177 start_codon:yes stop_codon:yes gene_type:complete